MNPIAYIKQRIALHRKLKELKRVEHWIWQCRDQIASGQAELQRAERKQRQLHAEIALLTPPDEIVRNGAQA